MHAPTAAPIPLDTLRARIRGQVLTADDDTYEAAAPGFYGGPSRRPGAIVRPIDATDVATVVGVARDHGLELAVRSGGHSMLRHSSTQDGLLLDLSSLRGIEVDAAECTAWADAGVRAGELTAATAEHGLVVGFGDAPSVGVSGITLGGGVGYLSRAHGLTIDNLLAAEIVTADGRVRHVDERREPELFWALRGGGGNFGVVTRLRFRLHELGPVQAGMLVLPATTDVVAGLVEITTEAEDELGVIANVMLAPPMPFLPPELHGQRIVLALLAHVGSPDTGRATVDRLRALATPLLDEVDVRPYGELFEEEPGGFHPRAVGRNFYRDHFDHRTAEEVLARLAASPADMAVVQLRALGGAIDRVAPEATAYAHRGRRLMVNVAAMSMREGPLDAETAWADAAAAALREPGVEGAYVNFHGVEDDLTAVYPSPTLARLAAIKRRYDPDNLFRGNHNIAPA